MLDPDVWAAVPFHFWSLVFFVFGAIVGSFLNVCIYRMPRGLSVVSPPSHCPHCGYSIPWFLNVPLITWLYLRGKCANCGAPISIRYFLVELLTGVAFLASWLKFGDSSALLPMAYCVLLGGFIAATFIDFEHFIIPDEITIGGIVAGFLLSFAIPEMHGVEASAESLKRSFLGIAAGGGLIYAILRLGKLLFGRQKLQLEPGSKIVFTDTSLVLPGQELVYEDIFYRNSDTVAFEAARLEMIDRCYRDVSVRLTPKKLRIGDDEFDPDTILHMEAITDRLILPREAMGFGDVKFMAAIGAFLGWPAVLFSLLVSSVLGLLAAVSLIALRRTAWSSRIPYGPYIAMAAVIWIFGGREWVIEWFRLP